MKLRFFDFEVFPHWWCCVFGDMPDNQQFDESIKDTFVVVDSRNVNAREQLINLLREQNVCNCGYNIKRYDLMIANAVYQGFTPEQVKIVNDLIIRPYECKYASKEHIRLQPFANKRFSCVYEDLLDDSVGSLKEKECSLGLNILESKVPFDKEDLYNEDIEDILYYCKHDVYAAMVFYQKVVEPYAYTKNNLGKRFNITEEVCRKNTNATIVGMVLGAKQIPFADSEKVEIAIPDKINSYCRANLPLNIINHITKNTSTLTVKLYDNTVSFGDGGIHSTICDNIYVEANDEYMLINVDATSYYPSTMIAFDLISRCCNNSERFKMIHKERLDIKAKDNPTVEEKELLAGDKLVMNTAYGASGNKYLAMFDPYKRTCVCRIGQLFLAAFANKCFRTIPNCKIIQTNTDGVLLYLPRKWLNKLRDLEAEWTYLSGIKMEEDIVQKIWQCNVNNYLLVQESHGKLKIKSKGSWLRDTSFNPGTVKMSPLTGFISAIAAKEFLLNGKDIIQTIVECQDLSKFAITCTKGPTFSKVVQKFNESTIQEYETKLYKSNRVIAVKDKTYGRIYKCKMYKGQLSYHLMPNIPNHCMLVNESLNSYNFDEIKNHIDYMYYINEAISLLDIEWYELKNNEISQTSQFHYDIG